MSNDSDPATTMEHLDDAVAAEISARARTVPSVRPALVVVGVAVVVLVLFGVLSAFLPGTTPTPATSQETTKPITGTTLVPIPASRPLVPIENAGTPPADVLRALVVPSGAISTSHTSASQSTGQYDATIDFSVHATQAALVTFFHTTLKSSGWRILSEGTARSNALAIQILGEKGSDDGWYWEVGATITPTRFSRTDAVNSTSYSIRLFEVPDSL